MSGLPEPVVPIAAQLAGALIALDFDGTLAPIVADPQAARPVDGVIDTLAGLASTGAQVAIVTGRDARTVLRLGQLDRIPGLIVNGLHGAESWRDGQLSTRDEPDGLAVLRSALPPLLPDGVWLEDKRLSLVVHTRQATDPDAALAMLTEPVTELVARHELETHPGKQVLEIRIPGLSKATALRSLLDRDRTAALFAGDDLGDLPAIAAIGQWSAATGRPGCTIAVGEVEQLPSDLRLADPAALAALLHDLLTAGS